MIRYIGIFLFFLFLTGDLFGQAVEIKGLWVRRGFDSSWTEKHPDMGDPSWTEIKGALDQGASTALPALGLKGMPSRSYLSLKENPPENFTFVAAFTCIPEIGKFYGVLFPNIGVNWEVYLNGTPIKSQVFIDEKGAITRNRHVRDALIALDSRLIKKGENILGIRIIGDPAFVDTGIPSRPPLIIDDLETLEKRVSERAAYGLIFLYLFFGLYHLFLYARMRNEKHNLIYGLLSVALFVYLITRTRPMYELFPDTSILHRIEFILLYVLVPLFGAFVDLLLAGRYSLMTKAAAVLYGILAVITILPFPYPFVVDALRIWQTTAIVPIIYYTVVRIGGPAVGVFYHHYQINVKRSLKLRISRAALQALVRTRAGNLMLGAGIVTLCVIIDLIDSVYWGLNYKISAYGFFVFIMGLSLILADRFIGMYRKVQSANAANQVQLDLAAHVQSSILPPAPYSFRDYDVAVRFVPMNGPSGDFYDIYHDRNTLAGVVLFDVSGHGISSALITIMLKVHAAAAFSETISRPFSEAASKINKILAEQLSGSDSFATGTLLRFSGRVMEYVNAGHPFMLYRKASDGKIYSPGDQGDSRGIPLGIDSNHKQPPALKIKPVSGDLFFLYTDGIIEARNLAGEHYGLDRLMATLDSADTASAAYVADAVLDDFYRFTEKGKVKDDLTFIVIRKK